jgi:exopolyphosphatase/guanosine-5'-triphosphate,3'-diphosphate pyrophosphatase
MQPAKLGVIDLGSNSGRLVLALREAHGIPHIVDESQVSLRLAEGLQSTGKVGRPATERALQALSAFRTMCERFGAERVIAAGTSALREAENGVDVVAELESETGVAVDVLSGEREAYYGYLAAVNSLPFTDGIVLDLGGGSLELAFVRGRECERALSFPFGTLRMTERFLRSDPPASTEVEALRRHVGQRLRNAGLEAMAPGQTLVGLGGTVRSLAKLVRRNAGLPSVRLHGFSVEAGVLRDLCRALARQNEAERRRIAGLPTERAGIIVAGAVVIREVLDITKVPSLLVCGHGLREGIAYEAFREGEPALIPDVRRAGVEAFAARYSATRAGEGGARDGDVERLALRLLKRLAPIMPPDEDDHELLAAAAVLCDTGRTVSLYRWPEHTLYLLANGDLTGFTQQEALLIAQVVAAQSGQRADLAPYQVTPSEADDARAGRLGVVLGLARWLSRAGVDAHTPVSVLAQGRALIVVLPPEVPLVDDEWYEGLVRACRRYLDRDLRATRLGD